MTRRYFTKAYWEMIDDSTPLPGMTVHEQEKCSATGLYDAEGRELYATNSQRMGFKITDN